MTVLIDFNETGARVRGNAPERPAPVPAKPANAGHGDVRKKIVPVIKPPAGPSVTDWEGGAYLSMQEWLDAPQDGGAILLQPADDPRVLAGKLEQAALIAVDFPRIGDGRGYSHAVLLRNRVGYAGPLRAVGAITADQIYALSRVAFTSFGLRADQDADTALKAVNTFSVPYQSTKDAPGAQSDRANANFNARVILLERALTDIAERHDNAALASSLSAEDMIVTDVIARLKLPIDVFTLDTGRLHQETLDLIAQTEERYGIDIEVFRPDGQAVAAYVTAHGKDGFYEGVQQRKLCCSIRKVEPLNRALKDRDAWLTGQRREQSLTRNALPEAEHDAERGIEKYNPLADWSWADVLAYAERFDIPMSQLYARGYVSIGCEPCTKAIRPGEDPRAGRWWWENQDSKECGLHTSSTTAR
jgi:phosphoadenosine phosphosulfate reductase